MKNMKARFIAAGLTAAAALSFSALSAYADDTLIYGDVNLDEKVTIADAAALLQHLANGDRYPLSKKAADQADVFDRGDGVSIRDPLSIQKYIANLIPELPESWRNGVPVQTTVTQVPVTTAPPTTTEPVVTEPAEPAVPTYINLRGNSIDIDGPNAAADGKKLTITHSGTYYIQGTLDDGQIEVAVPDENADPGTVKLFFKDVNITAKSAPAIFVKNADKTSITLMDGSENTISDGETAYSGDFAEAAIIEAKDDLTIKGEDAGTGKLTITANVQDGVFCNNDLKITGGVIDITTLDKENGNDALKGKKSLTIKDGTITIKAEGDAIKSSKGKVSIEGGNITAKCGNDAVQAETELNISGGQIAAFGDRGLRSAGTVNISGGTVLATATDYQVENLTASQAAFLFDFTKEWEKNNPITLLDRSGNTLVDINTLKKYSFAVVSSPELNSGSDYSLYAGGIQMFTENGKGTFTADTPAAYKNVNNTDESEILYGTLFTKDSVHNININMSQEQWRDFLANADKEEYYPCDVIIDGETFENAAIRTKGNSSRMFVSQAGKDKYSFRVKLDKYDKLQNYHGLTEFCMNNMYSDPSCMRDRLCYDAMENLKGYVPNTAYTNMYLNNELYSFYMVAEQPGKTLAERIGQDNDSCLYKATDKNNGDCTFTQSMSLDSFSLKFGNDEQLTHIREVVTAINSVSPGNYKHVEDVIDVESFLKGFAVNAVMCNYDSYSGSMAHNYYLMYSGGKMKYVGWDYNLALGNFMDYGASVNSDIKTGMYQADENKRPLIKNLLQIPEYYDMYIGYVNEIVSMYRDPDPVIAKYASVIERHVKADPRSFFTGDQFDKNIARSAEGLQVSDNGGGGMWGGGFGGGWGGGFGGWGGGFGGFGGGGGAFSFGGENVSIADFLVKRAEVIRSAIG